MSNIQFYTAMNDDSKFQLMEFIYKNTDSFILNTFGYVWENRKWWLKQPIMAYYDKDIIVGMHAFSVNTKAEDTLKTYYIVVDKKYRGKGIAKTLTIEALKEYRNLCKYYFVNSEENSDGVKFYKKLFGNQFTEKRNQFGSIDFEFKAEIFDLLKNES